MLLIDPTPFKETFQAAPKAAITYRGTEDVTKERGEFILKNGGLQGEYFPSAQGGPALLPALLLEQGDVLTTFAYAAVAGMMNGQPGTFVSSISFHESEEKLRQDESAKSRAAVLCGFQHLTD